MTYQLKTSGAAIIVLALIFALYTWLFWPTLVDIEQVWRGSDTYSHSYIIPLIIYWLYRQHEKPKEISNTHSWLPLFALPVLLVAWMLGYASDTASIAHFAAILSLQIIIIAWLGPGLAKHYQFAIFYLIFLVPFGDFLNLPLQNITADLTVSMLHMLNIPVFREGLFLSTPVGNFEVAVACSGLRFLIASLAIGTLFAHLTYRSFWRQCAFLVTLILFSILANGLRAALLILVAEETNMAYGFGDDHYVYGWVVFGLVMLFMFWLGGKFSDKPLSTPQSGAATQPVVSLKIPGYSKVQTGYIVLVLSLCLVWRMQLIAAPAVETPLPSLAIANTTAKDELHWGITFVQPQRVSLVTDQSNISYYRAEFAHRQQQGELINWNNKLFNEKIWTVSKSSVWHNTDLPARHLTLSSIGGDTLEIVYWYQIGDTATTTAWQVKLAQMLALFSGDARFGQINAVAVANTVNASNNELAAAVDRLRMAPAP